MTFAKHNIQVMAKNYGSTTPELNKMVDMVQVVLYG